MEVKFTIVWCFSGASTVSQRNAWRRSTELTSTLSIPEQHRWSKLEKDIKEKLKKWLSSIFHLRLLLIFAKWVSTKQVELYNFFYCFGFAGISIFSKRMFFSWINFDWIFSEYLQHAPCMRQAQAEYESCADQYQLRIKTLNKVLLMIMPILKQRLSHCVASQHHHHSPKFSFG